MTEATRSASRERVLGNWPRYDAAVLGFRNYWYPVLLSRQLGPKPRAITLCGERAGRTLLARPDCRPGWRVIPPC